MNSNLECFRLLDQARRQRVQAREFRQLAQSSAVDGVSFLGGIAADLEDAARTLEARVADGRCYG